MALQKDSVILELLAADDGYFVRAWMWKNVSPPPLERGLDLIGHLDGTVPEATFRTDRISADKTELKAELAAFIDGVFDVP